MPVEFDIAGLLIEPGTGWKPSPLDRLSATLSSVTKSAGAAASDWSSEAGLVLAAGSVSAAEEYFREVIIGSVLVCPSSQLLSERITTTLGAALSGSQHDILHTSLEEVSLSSMPNLSDVSKRYLGFSWKKDSTLGEALQLYHKVCVLRHCAVHSGGLVNRRNSLVLGVDAGSRVAFSGPDPLLSLVRVVICAARIFNSELYRFLLSRWIDEGYLVGEWGPDKDAFSDLWRVFAVRGDQEAADASGLGMAANPYRAYLGCRAGLRARQAALREEGKLTGTGRPVSRGRDQLAVIGSTEFVYRRNPG